MAVSRLLWRVVVKVIVLGAGVVGVTTAYYLAKQGAEVLVLDRQAAPGMETSYANAGELSYGMTSPWAAPGVPMKALKWLFMRHRAQPDHVGLGCTHAAQLQRRFLQDQ